MSQTIKQSLIILIVLLVISVAVAIFTIVQKQDVEKRNESLQAKVNDFEAKERTLLKQVQSFETQIKTVRTELEQKAQEAVASQKSAETAQKELARVTADMDKVRREKDGIDDKISDLRRQRDDLTKQIADLKSRPPEVKTVEKIVEKEKIVYRDRPVDAADAATTPDASGAVVAAVVPPPVPVAPDPTPVATPAAPQILVQNTGNEEYWAGVMRQKAALEIDLAKAKQDLEHTKIKIVEGNKVNSDQEIEIGRLKNEKDEIIRKIKYGEDLADNLSIELARARNDQKMALDRAGKIDADNLSLRQEIKQLTTTKVALEKSIARLTDDKAGVERKLVETENIIQNRIDDIWKIKKDIDSRFDARGVKVNSNEVELPPIVVNGGGDKTRAAAAAPAVKKSGTVVSVNEDNNFIVVDMGEKTGIKVGDPLKVYRNGNHIGSVEVIQVRKDISAADIKQKNSSFKPGDTVK